MLKEGVKTEAGTDPRQRVDWAVVERAAGLEVCAVVEETALIVIEWTREVVAAGRRATTGPR